MPTSHARLSASESGRWTTCVGSVALIETIPEAERQRSSRFADEGTAAHHVVERMLRGATHPSAFLGRWIRVFPDGGTSMLRASVTKMPGPDHYLVDDDMVSALDVMWQYVVRRLREEFSTLAELPDEEAVRRAVEQRWLLLEARVHFIPSRPDDGFGTCDVRIDAWPLLEAVDYKHGRGVLVEVDGNTQLQCYLRGAQLEALSTHWYFRGTIVQPRAHHGDGLVRTWPRHGEPPLTEEHMLGFGEMVETAGKLVDNAASWYAHACEAAQGGDPSQVQEWEAANLRPSEYACRFCRAKPFCGAVRRQVQEVARADFLADPVDELGNGPELPLPMDPTELAVLSDWVPHIRNWCKAILAAEYTMLANGVAVPGRKLVRAKTNRAYKPDVTGQDVAAKCVEMGWIEEDRGVELWEPPTIKSGPQIEKLMRGKGVGANRRAFSEMFLHRPEGGLTVAPDSDERPAVDPRAEGIEAARLEFADAED